MQTIYEVCSRYTFLLPYQKHANFFTVLFVFAGPTWRQRDGSVLVASRRFDGSRSRKTKGSLADTLQCNIWRRAQTPHRMTHCFHGGFDASRNNHGFTALGKKIGTPKSSDKDCAYVTEHPVLKYLRPKLPGQLPERLSPSRLVYSVRAACIQRKAQSAL